MSTTYLGLLVDYADVSPDTLHFVAVGGQNAPSGSLVVMYGFATGAVTVTVDDTLSNVWDIDSESIWSNGSSHTAFIAYSILTSGLFTADEVNVHLSASGSCGFAVHTFSEPINPPLDVASASDNGAADSAFDSGPITATTSASIVAGLLVTDSDFPGLSVTEPNYIALNLLASGITSHEGAPYYKIVSSAGEQRFSGTYTPARQNVAVVTVLKATGSAGPGGVLVTSGLFGGL